MRGAARGRRAAAGRRASAHVRTCGSEVRGRRTRDRARGRWIESNRWIDRDRSRARGNGGVVGSRDSWIGASGARDRARSVGGRSVGSMYGLGVFWIVYGFCGRIRMAFGGIYASTETQDASSRRSSSASTTSRDVKPQRRRPWMSWRARMTSPVRLAAHAAL